MPYAYITSHNSPNYTAARNVPSVFGQARKVKSITIHHWGDPKNKPQFDGIVSWLCRPNGNSSAHYVVEAGKVACIIDPDNAAWHAGNAVGNATSIGIELNPREQDGDYVTAAELIGTLRKTYGDVPLFPHRHWASTECPGTYDLARLDRLARGGTVTPTPPKPAPAPSPAAVFWTAGPKVVTALQDHFNSPGRHDGTFDSQDSGRVGNFPRDRWTTIQWVAPGAARGSVGVGAIQRGLGLKQDRLLGPATAAALQRWAGMTGADVDSICGTKTVAAICTKLGIK